MADHRLTEANVATIALIVLSALGVLYDTRRLGLHKGSVKGPGNIQAFDWVTGTLFLWPLVFPFYLAYRQELLIAKAAMADPSIDIARGTNRAAIVFAKWVVATIVCLVGLVASIGLNGITPQAKRLPITPPAYIKSIAALKEGYDGLQIYFVLADSTGALTTAAGKLHLTISQTESVYEPKRGWVDNDVSLFERTTVVDRSAFRRTTVGMGPFEREVILFSLGRVAYSQFRNRPGSRAHGKVTIVFQTADGQTLRGEELVFF